jgi:hypothetical protein
MRKFQEYLGSGDALCRLTREAVELAELDRVYRRAVPAPLADASGVDHIDGGTLILWADNGAVAAKLRQLSPTVLGRLQARAPHCTTVRVVVRLGVGTTAQKRAPARIGSGGAAALQELAGALPSSSLRDALTRLAARAGDPSKDGE